jgi:transposase-like protein
MKKSMSLWFKIKFLILWLNKHKGTATIVTCGNCNSTRVTFKNGKQKHNVYTSEYRCLDCGATAKCFEIWHFNNK